MDVCLLTCPACCTASQRQQDGEDGPQAQRGWKQPGATDCCCHHSTRDRARALLQADQQATAARSEFWVQGYYGHPAWQRLLLAQPLPVCAAICTAKSNASSLWKSGVLVVISAQGEVAGEKQRETGEPAPKEQ